MTTIDFVGITIGAMRAIGRCRDAGRNSVVNEDICLSKISLRYMISHLAAHQRIILRGMITCLILTTGEFANAAYPVRPGDSVWEVSSRHLRGSFQMGAPLRISKVVGCSYEPSSLEEFIVDPIAEQTPRTIVYVHGNWMEWDNARERGLLVYKFLASQGGGPIRLILFSWPSQREGRIAPDVREKATLAHIEAYYLADFLRDVPNDRPIGMMGFSFGGAVICGSLQLLAGGALDCRVLPQPIVVHRDVRVSLVAPAFERNLLNVGGKYELALDQMQRLVNIYNSADPVLKRFRFIDRGSPVAAGFLGLNARGGSCLTEHRIVEQYDCTRSAGRTHSEVEYYQNCPSFKISLKNALGE